VTEIVAAVGEKFSTVSQRLAYFARRGCSPGGGTATTSTIPSRIGTSPI
jgi:hypothetical protein